MQIKTRLGFKKIGRMGEIINDDVFSNDNMNAFTMISISNAKDEWIVIIK